MSIYVAHAIILDEIDFDCDSTLDIDAAVSELTQFIERSLPFDPYVDPAACVIAIAFERSTVSRRSIWTPTRASRLTPQPAGSPIATAFSNRNRGVSS